MGWFVRIQPTAILLKSRETRVKNFFPIFVENSRLPVVLSKLSPINIWAISLGLFVFCRGELSAVTKNHETIHFRQWVELLFVGF